MGKKRKILTTQLEKHPALQAWRMLGASGGIPDRIIVLKEKKKGGVYALTGVRRGGETVIAKRCHVDKGTLERTVYTHVLPQLRTMPLEFYGSVDEDEWVWLFLEDAGNERFDPENGLHCRHAAQWLAALHALVEREHIPDLFPERNADTYKQHLQSAKQLLYRLARERDTSGENRILSQLAEHCDSIDDCWDSIERFSRSVPVVFAHNDCLAKNVHVRGSGATISVVPFDWGGAGWAPAGTDLGLLALPELSVPDNEPDVEAYATAIAGRWRLDFDTVRRMAALGQLFWALKVTHRCLQQIEALAHKDVWYLFDKLEIYSRTLSGTLHYLRDDLE